MMNRFSFLLASLFVVPQLLFADPSAIEQMRTVMDEVIAVVEAHPEDEQKKERIKKLRTVISPNFDFREMAKRSLGANWNKANTEQQEEFVTLFSDLLATTYLNRIANVRKGMVSLDSERVKEPKAMVKTTVTYKGETFPIDYKMLDRGERWKVYDVIIENIGLVANYRTEFAGVIRKEKFSGLLKRLRKKVEG